MLGGTGTTFWICFFTLGCSWRKGERVRDGKRAI